MPQEAARSLDRGEVARFSKLADAWWTPRGAFAPLHRLNPVRLSFIRHAALARFGGGERDRRPFAGLTALDIGCGGGLVCEPLARLGFAVAGVDASAETIERAREHAAAHDLAIDYRLGAIEDLAGDRPLWNLVLALEVIEHVAEPASFLRAALDRVAPGGLLIISTLNRTLKSLALGKIAAEYLLGWAPAGTHDWRRFVTPGEAMAMAAPVGSIFAGPEGMVFDPSRGAWRRASDTSVNYIMALGVAGRLADRCPGATESIQASAERSA